MLEGRFLVKAARREPGACKLSRHGGFKGKNRVFMKKMLSVLAIVLLALGCNKNDVVQEYDLPGVGVLTTATSAQMDAVEWTSGQWKSGPMYRCNDRGVWWSWVADGANRTQLMFHADGTGVKHVYMDTGDHETEQFTWSVDKKTGTLLLDGESVRVIGPSSTGVYLRWINDPNWIVYYLHAE